MRTALIKYTGGKQRNAESIVNHFPQYDEYIEPFIGGGSVFFAAKLKYPKAKYWINDANPSLIAMYRSIQKDGNEFHRQVLELLRTDNQSELFYSLKYLRDNSNDEWEKGVATYIVSRALFNGYYNNGYCKKVFEKSLKESIIKEIPYYSVLLQDVRITNLDYKEVIKDNEAFYYLDPPYIDIDKKYDRLYQYKIVQDEFFELVLSLKKARFLMSNANEMKLREMFSGYKIVPELFRYQGQSKKVYYTTELLIMN